MDKMFADSLKKYAVNQRDYESMYVETKRLAHLVEQKQE